MNRQTTLALEAEGRNRFQREFFAMMARVAQEPADPATPDLWDQLKVGSRKGLPPSDGLALPPGFPVRR